MTAQNGHAETKRKPNPPFRAEQVGSFLRPAPVRAAREQYSQGKLSADELRAVEDEAIRELVAKQRASGLKIISDGECRRLYFHLDFLEQLGGMHVSSNDLGDGNLKTHTIPTLSVVGKIEHVRPIQLRDFRFLQSLVKSEEGEVAKVCIPSPTMAHFRRGREGISMEAYPELEEFYSDLAAAYRAEIQSLYDAGCRYIQLDDTNLAYLCDESMRAAAESRGEDLSTLPNRYAQLINSCITPRPADLCIAMHLCRGNFRSTFFAQGGYAPVAEVLFSKIDVDVLLLEWENERSGDFEPLRHLVPGRAVVLGIVSSKFGEMEKMEDMVERIQQAGKYCQEGIQQLAVSPQCGFSSTYHGNDITEEQQWAKMKFVCDVAREVWGTV
ncbi:UROD/MetE-like protein [Calocera cornea HHB12733]|uniref:UROD/MetE-like protein n=1 Tax=Calocera cornea HHB12733 TaxID=1353952 RepID=A0A165ENF4_9BASI|nr:UROD/MetE-like protein [Calocera cornea HHB12733]